MKCDIPDCERDRYQNKPMCGSHYMKWWRYGDPHYKAPSRALPIAGRRFGTLTARQRTDDGRWECDCDCGGQRTASLGELNRGLREGIVTCGDKRKHWAPPTSYRLAHDRVTRLRGRAKQHACVDCGGPARQWSYDRTDPKEQQSDLGPWSSSIEHYQPRCIPCHKRFDLDAIAATDAQPAIRQRSTT